VEHLKEAPLYVRLLALPTNIRLGWKGLPGTNTLAYYEYSYITDVKVFIILGPGINGNYQFRRGRLASVQLTSLY
jgi:hypothetical protein